MVILSIEYDCTKDRFKVQCDNNKSYTIGYDEFEDNQLRIGKEVDIELLEILEQENLFDKFKQLIINYCSYRTRSKKELVDRLRKANCPDNIVPRVLNFLESKSMLNDEEFTRIFVEDKLRLTSWSRRKIEYELYHKGISKETIQTVFESLDDIDEYEKANEIIQCKMESWKKKYDGYKLRQKVYQYLSYRGFNYDTISQIMDKL